MSIVHGGNVYEVADGLGISPDSILDFSASINPQGPPAGLLETFNKYYHRLQHYPDIHNRSLVDAIARVHGMPSGRVVVGNGSTELIYVLPRALGIRTALIVLPTFSEYRRAFASQQIDLTDLITTGENYFQPTVEQLESTVEAVRPEAILVTHPGSPAGCVLPSSVRKWLAAKSAQNGIYCLVDEVFVDYCEEKSFKGLIDESSKLIIIRSMTKFYGIPGLRLGYLLTSENLAESIAAHLPPWSVNTLAQIAGKYCLEQDQYRAGSLSFMEQERTRMLTRLNGLKGCRVFPSRANYVLIELASGLPAASELQQELLSSDRILIRDCSSFEGLNSRYVRFAVRLPDQNDRLLDAFARWLARHV